MECRDLVDKEMWGNVESRECQKRASHMGGWSCDRWEAQWQLSCTLTEISYGRQKDKEDRKGI